MADTVSDLEILRDENERLKRALENSIAALLVSSENGTIVFANENWAQMHGYDTPGEILQKPLAILFEDDYYMTHIKPFLKGIALEKFDTCECWHKKGDGSKFPMWLRVIHLKNEAGEPAGFAWSGWDIGEQKKTEAELEEKLKELERVNQLMIDREIRMKELKAENERLKQGSSS